MSAFNSQRRKTCVERIGQHLRPENAFGAPAGNGNSVWD